MIKHLNIKIYGAVQGVFFRTNAKKEAENLSIAGFVRNERDGTVYIEAEGEEKSLDEFLKWCRKGPDSAQVEKIEVETEPVKNFSEFSRDFTDY